MGDNPSVRNQTRGALDGGKCGVFGGPAGRYGDWPCAGVWGGDSEGASIGLSAVFKPHEARFRGWDFDSIYEVFIPNVGEKLRSPSELS
jgi:hypothetical protein